VSRARVDDNDRRLHGIGRDIVGGDDAYERVIGWALERAAVAQDFHREVQNMRRHLGRLRDIGVSPRVQRFHEKNAALRRVPPIFRGRVEQSGTLRHHIFLVGLTVGYLGATLRTGAPFAQIEPLAGTHVYAGDIALVRTTIFGGILFLAPVVDIWLILGKAYHIAERVLLPLTALIPESLSARTTITAVFEVLLFGLAFMKSMHFRLGLRIDDRSPLEPL
jgi:hypothetical protein